MIALIIVLFIVIYPIIMWTSVQNKKEKRKREENERIQQHMQREAHLKKLREEQEARLREEEQKHREEAEARRRAEEERNAEYEKMVNSIKKCPIVISEEYAKKIPISFINSLTYSTITIKSNLELLGNFVVIDTETTGLKSVSDEIIEIAAIRFRNFQPVEKFTSLLTSKKPIPERVTEINHITDDMVAEKPYFQQIAHSLVNFIGDDNLVGHNLPFDLKFIVHYGANVTEKKRKYFDTLALAQKTIKKVKMKWDREFGGYYEDYLSDGVLDHKLVTLCRYLDIPHSGAHRAENDALATGRLFQKLAEMRVNKMK